VEKGETLPKGVRREEKKIGHLKHISVGSSTTRTGANDQAEMVGAVSKGKIREREREKRP